MMISNDGIRRAARWLRYATMLGMGLIAISSAFAAAVLATGGAWIDSTIVTFGEKGLAPRPAAALLLLVAALLAIALARLARMLDAVERGRLFAPAHLRGFGLYLFLAVLASVLGPPLIQIVHALAAGGGKVTLSLDGGEVLMLFVTGLLFLVARLLDAAQSISDEMSQIV